jgi:K(+)-stimulated pyrophosphate-energized sodium pump
MSNNQNVVDTGSSSGLHKWVAIILALLLLLMWMLGYGPGGAHCNPTPVAAVASAPAILPAPPPATAATSSSATVTPPAAASSATAPVMPAAAMPEAKVYFAVDKVNLPKDVDGTLSKVVEYLKANGDAKASISGFHDPSGNKEHNEDLALNRARAVRGALDQLGIPNDRVVMQKPVESTGSGDPAHARRVDVSIAKP